MKKNKYFGKFLLDFIYKDTDAEYIYGSDKLEDVEIVCDQLIHEADKKGYDCTHYAFIIYQSIGSMQ